jgi:hypothetical protein
LKTLGAKWARDDVTLHSRIIRENAAAVRAGDMSWYHDSPPLCAFKYQPVFRLGRTHFQLGHAFEMQVEGFAGVGERFR